MKYNFEDLLISYNEYFYMSSKVDQKTFSPIFIFVCKKTSSENVFPITRIDISDYNSSKRTPKSIKDMNNSLKCIIRENKINLILNGTNNN